MSAFPLSAFPLSLGKGALSGKLAAVFTGIATFTVSDYLTNKLPLAIIVSAVCTVIVASIKTKPRRIEAESAAAMGVVERMDRLHHEQIKFYHDRLTQQNKLIAILTISKHAFAGENESLRDHCRLRGELLQDLSVRFPDINPKDFSQLVKAEDMARAEISGLPPILIESIHGSI